MSYASKMSPANYLVYESSFLPRALLLEVSIYLF